MDARSAASHQEPTAIHAVPAELRPAGFRVLLLREFRIDGPPGFALVEQHLLRLPHRLNRHGVSFALTFRPEVMAGLSADIGRPSARDGAGRVARNPRWPTFGWCSRPRSWPDGTTTVEWLAEVAFPGAEDWAAFCARFAERLAGRLERPGSGTPSASGDLSSGDPPSGDPPSGDLP